MRYTDFVDLGYRPRPDELVCRYYVEPARGVSFEEVAGGIAAESSIGTWTEIATMNKRIARTLKPRVYGIDKRTNVIDIAYPEGLFELGNMPEILSSIAGNIFGIKIADNLRLLDISFPKNFVKSFPGPEFGVGGIRKLLKVGERPLIGTIIKPKLGLTYREHARVAYDAWAGGLDIVKDDENLSNQRFNPFRERIRETLKAKERAGRETGERKIYMPNVTAECGEMLRRAEFVKGLGGEYIMVDVLTVGFSALQTLRDAGFRRVMHGHRAMHGALTRNRKHGISMLALAKIFRLMGVDQLHIGTAVGKMEGSAKDVIDIKDAIESDSMNGHGDVLSQEWFGMKKTLAVCSGGLHPGHVPKLVEILGNDIVIQAGGGCHGHPRGTSAGAAALRQAVDATNEGIDLNDYAEKHIELAEALETWK